MSLKVLTVKQPWASALVRGEKDVENRIWTTTYRGWVLIHAGLKWDESVISKQVAMTMPRGHVIGAIKLTSIVHGHDSGWAQPGCWHWLHDTSAALILPNPVPWRGVQGLIQAPQELLSQIPTTFLGSLV